jgi:lycopene cyclase CruA
VLSGVPEGEGPLERDPACGEILVTTEGIEDGRQHIWEGFPAPLGGMTVYLFHYSEPSTLPPHPLLSLYERFFSTLPRYKRGAPQLLRPTYGIIPAYTRLRPMPVSPRPRVLLVGDAAARHSPLTFCGFGSMIRSFLPVSSGILRCLEADDLSRRALSAVWTEPPSLRVMGGLTLMMTSRRRGGDSFAVNQLLDAAFATLSEAGEDTYAALLRDEIGFSEFFRFMNGTARRYPAVYREALATLKRGELARWLMRLVQLSLSRRALPADAT